MLMTSIWRSIKSLVGLKFGKNTYTGGNLWQPSMGTFHELIAIDIDGNSLNLNSIALGNVVLITNVACKCGFTQDSYKEMERLILKYGVNANANENSNGLKILLFPCNQFLSQEPWPENEIKKWVINHEQWPQLFTTHDTHLFSKIEVNGENTHPLYVYLKTCFPGDIQWNFATKFVIGKDGIPVQRFDKNQTWQEIELCIQQELEK